MPNFSVIQNYRETNLHNFTIVDVKIIKKSLWLNKNQNFHF